jgi:hypothetical protein
MSAVLRDWEQQPVDLGALRYEPALNPIRSCVGCELEAIRIHLRTAMPPMIVVRRPGTRDCSGYWVIGSGAGWS